MISGGRADHAAALLLFGHQREFVERPADLVRADALEHLGLEADVESRQLAELPRGEQWRVLDVWGDARADFLEVAKGEGEHGA